MESKFKTRTLADYFDTSDFIGLITNRGPGIRKWNVVQNADWTFHKDIQKKVERRIFETIRRSQCDNLSSISALRPEGKEIQHLDDNLNGLNCTDRNKDGIDVVDRAATVKIISRKMPGDDAIIRKYLENPAVTHVEIEGCLCRKEMLMEWALNALKSSEVSKSQSQSTQTDVSASEDPNNLKCRDAGARANSHSTNANTSMIQGQQLIASSSQNPSHPHQSFLLQQPQQQQQQQNVLNPVSYDSHLNTEEYEKAKNWVPKDDQQKKAFEQAQSDLFNVLMVGNGCALRRILREFCRVVQESLDLSLIGIPDLRTLLVQMGDLIYLMKERYTGNVYVFPTMSNDKFETVAHIGELVAEQRIDKNYDIPDRSILLSCDIRELFQRQVQRYQAPSLQSSYYANPYYYNYNNQWYYPPHSNPGILGQYQNPQQYQQQQYQQYLAESEAQPSCRLPISQVSSENINIPSLMSLDILVPPELAGGVGGSG